MRKLNAFVLALGLVSAVAAHSSTVVFSDNFDDGDVSDWTVSQSAGVNAPMMTVRSDVAHSGFALWTYFDAPAGGLRANFVRASRSFDAALAGDYALDLWARAADCTGCTMSFDILVDGNLLTRDGSSPGVFKQYSTTLTNLAIGSHTLTLGMYTDEAWAGRFEATFDDVSIAYAQPTVASVPSTQGINAVPEPGALSLALGAFLALQAVRRRKEAR